MLNTKEFIKLFVRHYPWQGQGLLAAAATVVLCSVLGIVLVSDGTGGLHTFWS